VDRLIIAATGQPDTAQAWRSLVKPEDRVGIKVAAEGGRYFGSHRGIVEAIIRGLEASGIAPPISLSGIAILRTSPPRGSPPSGEVTPCAASSRPSAMI